MALTAQEEILLAQAEEELARRNNSQVNPNFTQDDAAMLAAAEAELARRQQGKQIIDTEAIKQQQLEDQSGGQLQTFIEQKASVPFMGELPRAQTFVDLGIQKLQDFFGKGTLEELQRREPEFFQQQPNETPEQRTRRIGERLQGQSQTAFDQFFKQEGGTIQDQTPEDIYQSNIRRGEIQEEAYPATSQAAKGLGFLDTLLLTRNLPGKGLAGVVGTGAAYSAAEKPEDEGLFEFDIKQRAKNAAIGGAVTLATLGAGKAIGKAAQTKIAKSAGRKLNNFINDVTGSTSGISPRVIDTFRRKTREILRLSKKVGGDITEEVDKVKAELFNDVAKFKKGLSTKIDDALEASNIQGIDFRPIMKKLVKVRDKLHKVSDADDIVAINEAIGDIAAVGESGGLKDLHAIYRKLKDKSMGTFIKKGEFTHATTNAKRAYKEGYREAASILNKTSPEIGKVNKIYSQIHEIEGEIQKSLIKEGAAPKGFLGAGAAESSRNRRHLKKIDDLMGTNLSEKAENLAAVEAFNKPKLTTAGFTGETLTRTLMAGGTGYVLGKALGGDNQTGLVIAAVLTSPRALKQIIKTEAITKSVLSKAIRSLNNPDVRKAIQLAGVKLSIPKTRSALIKERNRLEKEKRK